MENSWTPGPWRYWRMPNSGYRKGIKGHWIKGPDGKPLKFTKTNGRLMAKAPEMAELLEDMKKSMDEGGAVFDNESSNFYRRMENLLASLKNEKTP